MRINSWRRWTLARRLQALVGVAALLDIALLAFLFSPWSPSRAHAEASYQTASSRFQMLRNQTGEIARLRSELLASRSQIHDFTSRSMPPSRMLYSASFSELNRLAARQRVSLSGVNFHPRSKVRAGLRAIAIGGTLSGPYAGLLRFLNVVERDPIFFLIRQVTLSRRHSYGASASGEYVRLHILLETFEREPPGAAAAAARRKHAEGSAP